MISKVWTKIIISHQARGLKKEHLKPF